MKKYVLVFDICSSTVMIENLVQGEHIEDYATLIDGFYAYLLQGKEDYFIEIYKFLGDGFILFLNADQKAEMVLSFCSELISFAHKHISWFKEHYLDVIQLPREGITIGLAYGSVYPMKTHNIQTEEYVGRAINLSYRLQSTLSKAEHANRVLMDTNVYRATQNQYYKKACRRTTRSLRNMSGGIEIQCYEFNPELCQKQDPAGD